MGDGMGSARTAGAISGKKSEVERGWGDHMGESKSARKREIEYPDVIFLWLTHLMLCLPVSSDHRIGFICASTHTFSVACDCKGDYSFACNHSATERARAHSISM